MKLLLDENLPHKMRDMLAGHDCFTVTFMGWAGVENGALLQVAAANGFDAFVSTDKGLQYEQNVSALPLAVVVLMVKANKLKTIESVVPLLLRTLEGVKPKSFLRVEAGG